MQVEVDFFSGIRRLLSYHNIISISGESGTGKTTLALQLIGKLLTYEEPYSDSCIWIQASEIFPVKRLTQIFQEQPRKFDYIQKNIYVIPPKNPIHTYEQQGSIIQHIIGTPSEIPPTLKYIVIDNISHHLRYKLTHFSTPKDISIFLDAFYEIQLMPIILFCQMNEIVLILIHEVTYSPKLDKVRPFFYKLYDRIKTIDIVLSNIYNKEKKKMQINFNKKEWIIEYWLSNRGFIY
ncbi:MAG: NB-ARC domain-containing protein [Promethearchaeota archaeon]